LVTAGFFTASGSLCRLTLVPGRQTEKWSARGRLAILLSTFEISEKPRFPKFLSMKKLIIILCGLAIAESAFARSYRVHFSIYGRRHATIVQAGTPRDARDAVQQMHPGAIITNVAPVR
jgi:hypothetical protein